MRKIMKCKSNQLCTKKSKTGVLIKRSIISWLLIFPALYILYFFKYRPQVLGTIWSFFGMRGYTITSFVGLDNYKRIFADPNFQKAFVNTLKYLFWSLVIGFPLPIILAVCLDEIKYFRKTARFFVYFPAILPGTAVALMWYFIYYPDASGLLNIVLAKLGCDPYTWLQDGRFTILYIILSMSWSGCGPTAIYYFSALQSVQQELYEAVIVDGGGFWTRVRVVTLPHLSGIVLLFFIKQIMGVFTIMEQPMLMTDGGPNGASDTLGYLIYKYGFVYNKPQFSMALGVVMFLLLMIFTVFYFFAEKNNKNNIM